MTSESLQVVASAFDPTGQLLASVIPSLDVHKLRIHCVSNFKSSGSSDDNNSSLGSDNEIAQLTLERGTSVQCLTWASTSISQQKQPKKKRKRSETVAPNGPGSIEDSVVLLGTNKGSLLLFSPVTSSIVGTLSGSHSLPITSISPASAASVWSCDSSGRVCEWNINKKILLRSFTSSEPDISLVYSLPPSTKNHILLASSNIFVVDLALSVSSKLPKSAIINSFPGFVHPISSIVFPNNQDLFLCSSKNERNISIFSLSQGKLTGLLISLSDVESFVLNEDDSVLAAITDDGLVELFTNPLNDLVESSSSSSPPSKRNSRKSLTNSTKSSIQIRVRRPSPSEGSVKVEQVVFHEDHILVSWLENASIPVFQKVRWKDETTGKALSGLIEIIKARCVPGGGKITSGSDLAAPTPYNEASIVVTSGKDVQNLEDDDEDDDDEEDEGTLADRLDALEVGQNGGDTAKSANGIRTTTGGNIQGSTPANGKLIPKIEFSTPGSFAVILNQALKTNDRALLESCLVNRDEAMVKISVQRLDSSLAVNFLERLAEKLARSPSRAGQLNIWIKWVMISHGGYLVTLPNLLKTLSSLHSTVSDRVTTLPRLLALQGRLELLNSQMELRRELLAESRRGEQEDNEDEDEAAVEYVEEGPYIMNGEEDFEDDEDYEDDNEDSGDEDEDADEELLVNGKLKDDFNDDTIMGEDDEGYSDLEVGEPISGDDEEENEDDTDLEVTAVSVKKGSSASGKVNGRYRH